MFKGRIISRSHVNGKVHTFQKDFDDYDSYRAFLDENPEFLPRATVGDWWSPWKTWNPLFPDFEEVRSLPKDTRHLPEGVNLEKYEKRRLEKRQSETEKIMKQQSLLSTEAYFKDYLEENPEDEEARSDLEKVQKELKLLGK